MMCRSICVVIFSVFFELPQAMAFDHDHNLWAMVLKQHVRWEQKSSRLNYAALKEDPLVLSQYLKEVSSVSAANFQTWNRDEQLAFLINAYNAWTIQLILDHYPVKSIKDIGGFFSSPWKKEFFVLFGKKRHLDWLEHDKIRKFYPEPRIHFALVCASIGCPGLQPVPFTASHLNKQLDAATRIFLNDTTRNRYDKKSNELELSPIFKWYREDFVNQGGSVQEFVLTYADSLQGLAKESLRKISISYLDYDWSLNEIKGEHVKKEKEIPIDRK